MSEEKFSELLQLWGRGSELGKNLKDFFENCWKTTLLGGFVGEEHGFWAILIDCKFFIRQNDAYNQLKKEEAYNQLKGKKDKARLKFWKSVPKKLPKNFHFQKTFVKNLVPKNLRHKSCIIFMTE